MRNGEKCGETVGGHGGVLCVGLAFNAWTATCPSNSRGTPPIGNGYGDADGNVLIGNGNADGNGNGHVWPFSKAKGRNPSLTEVEVGAGAWVAASTGGAWMLSDDLVSLPQSRWAWGLSTERGAAATGGVPATPESFFPERVPTELKSMNDDLNLFNAEQQVPSKWHMPDGRRIGFNWTSSAQTIEGVQVPAHADRELPSL